jgi:hypothetical protein
MLSGLVRASSPKMGRLSGLHFNSASSTTCTTRLCTRLCPAAAMLVAALAGAHTLVDPHHRLQRRRSKSEITIPNSASATDASLQGTLRANKRRGRGGGEGKKHRGAGEKSHHHHHTKPEQHDGANVEGELRHHCRQAREQQHGQKAEGGKCHAYEE